jgi:hypothetical protein
MVTLEEVSPERSEEIYYNLKIYKRDFKFITFVARELRQPRIRIVEFMTSLLALAILRPDEIYNLFKEVVEQSKEMGP